MVKIKVVNNKSFAGNVPIKGEIPKQCPLCGAFGAPPNKNSVLSGTINNTLYLIDRYLCESCEEYFSTTSFVKLIEGKWVSTIVGMHPASVPSRLPDSIREFSPRAEELYEAAQKNQTFNYFEVAGITLRSATEFLIKDFAVNILGEKRSDVGSKKLHQAIANYMNTIQLQVPANMVRIYGNDFTHWENKLSKEDIPLMFDFFDILVRTISLELKAREMGAIKENLENQG